MSKEKEEQGDFGGGWNYRMLMVREGGEITLNIHEVYYNDKGEPRAWSENPIYAQGSSRAGLADDLILMQKALRKPVLEETIDGLVERKLTLTQDTLAYPQHDK